MRSLPSFIPISALALVTLIEHASANEALDFLEKETTGPIYPGLTTSEAQVAKKKTVVPPPDLTLPSRWGTELEPFYTFERPTRGLFQLSPRVLLDWQYQGTSGLGTEDIDSTRFRRARLGFALLTYYDTEIKFDSSFDGSGNYLGIETLQASLPLKFRNNATKLRFGKFPPPFSQEYSRDAAVRWIPELSPLIAQIAPASSLGALIEGRENQLEWKLGWFSSDTDRNIPSIDTPGYLLAGIGYTFNGVPVGENGAHQPLYQRWHLDYIHNLSPDSGNNSAIPNQYRNLVATGIQHSSGRLDAMGELIFASGSDTTAWGISLTGGYWLLQDAIRFVGRYHYATSEDPGGIVTGWGIPNGRSDLAQPFDFPVTRAGDNLHSIYAGLNFHLYRDQWLLNTGIEYRGLSGVTTGSDLDIWTWHLGSRVNF